MSDPTRMYREQHAHLRSGIRELASHLVPRALRMGGKEARAALSRLSGRLHVHLAMEDESLYPALLVHADGDVRDAARRLQAEVGSLRAELDAHLGRWPSAQEIEGRAEAFVAETEAVLATLEARIAREDRELFPLVDAAE